MPGVSTTIIREFEELFSKISATESRRNQPLAGCRKKIERTLKELGHLIDRRPGRFEVQGTLIPPAGSPAAGARKERI
jgi:hypothetical protein